MRASNSVLNVFLVHNNEHEGGNQTLSKQRKYYKENVNIIVIISQAVGIRKVRACFSLIDLKYNSVFICSIIL